MASGQCLLAEIMAAIIAATRSSLVRVSSWLVDGSGLVDLHHGAAARTWAIVVCAVSWWWLSDQLGGSR